MISPLFRCSRCAARPASICASFRSETDLDSLEAARSGTRNLRGGETVFYQHDEVDRLYIVLSGWVYLYKLLPDDRRQILRFAMTGDSFGVVARGKHRVDYGVEAMTDASVCVLSNRRIGELRERYPAFFDCIVDRIEQDEYAMMDLLTTVGRRNATERVAYLLHDIHCRARRKGLIDTVGDVMFPASQPVIADAIGLTAVHVNRVLRSLREMGILKFTRGKLTIMNSIRLTRLLNLNVPEVGKGHLTLSA